MPTLPYSDQAQRSGGVFLFSVLKALKYKQFKFIVPALRKEFKKKPHPVNSKYCLKKLEFCLF